MPALLISTSTRPRQATARSHSAGERGGVGEVGGDRVAPVAQLGGELGEAAVRAQVVEHDLAARARRSCGRWRRRSRPTAPVTSTTRPVKSIMGPPVGSAPR